GGTQELPEPAKRALGRFLARGGARAWYASTGSAWLGLPTMLRACSCVIALNAMVVALSTAQAAEPETLTLACQGTVSVGKTAEGKPEGVSLGIIVNFTKGTVHGLASFPANITGADETRVSFSGSQIGASIDGTIDRVTGDAEATFIMENVKTRDI